MEETRKAIARQGGGQTPLLASLSGETACWGCPTCKGWRSFSLGTAHSGKRAGICGCCLTVAEVDD